MSLAPSTQSPEESGAANTEVHAIRNALFAARLDLYTLCKIASEGGASAAIEELARHCEGHLERAELLLDEVVAPASSPLVEEGDEACDSLPQS